MIFGFVGKENSNTFDYIELSKLSEVFLWSTCSQKYIDFDLLKVCILIDKRSPLNLDDYLFIDEERGILILIDGFIYNINQLAISLFPDNKVSKTIPELIAHAFVLKGTDFIKDLNGDFAICIYTKFNQGIYFYRDHLGIRPIAVSHSASGVFFSTDPMGLSKALNQGEKADPNYILNLFLLTGYNYSILPNKRVIMIPPAHFMEINNRETILKQFWHPDHIKKDQSLNFDQVISDLDELVNDAIIIRCDQRYIASAHVSGGLDSGIIAAISRKEYAKQMNFYGFSWSPSYNLPIEKVDFDERLLVEEICKMNKILPVYNDFTAYDTILQMKSWRYLSVITFENRVLESAKNLNVNILFSGWGGDEFVSIGNRGIDADLIKEFSWKSYLKKYPLNQPKKIASSLLFNVMFPAARRKYYRYKSDPVIYPYIKNTLGSNLIPKNQRFDFSSRKNVHLQLLKLGHLNNRTKDWYVHGQQLGIEYRYPLLDRRIIEYMLKVPSRCLVGGNNYRILLRFIGKNVLPENVLKNKSKNDPVKSHFNIKYSNEAYKQLLNEYIDFRSNPELDFVDFNLLEKDISLYKKLGNEKLEEKIWSILFYLKLAHEFTKGYNY